MLKIFQKRIYREDLRANPNVIYLFGDNLLEVGMGGQAGEMRGEPNAVGIPTKKAPGMGDEDFFTDDEFKTNCQVFDLCFRHIKQKCPCSDDIVVIPLDGLGTGLAELDIRAPRTFVYLEERLRAL